MTEFESKLTQLRRRFKRCMIATVGYWWREYSTVFRDKEVLVFFYLLTLVYPILYALIYNPEAVTDVPVAVVDNNRTALSHRLIRNFDATSVARVVDVCANMEEARRLMMQRDSYAVLEITQNFDENIMQRQQGVVVMYADMSLLLNYKGLLMALTDVTLAMDAELRTKSLPIGVSQSLSDIINNPIPYTSVVMYNADSGVASFLIPAVLVLVLQQSLILGIAMLVGASHEKKRGWYSRYFMVSQLIGRSLCYFSLYIFNVVYLLHFIPWLFGYPQLGNVGEILLFSIPLLLSSIFFAMMLSKWVRWREYAYLLFVFTSVVFLFLSGIAWPRFAMPVVWKWVASVIPSTWGIEGFVRLSTMGASLSQVSQPYTALWILVIVYFVMACIVAKSDRE